MTDYLFPQMVVESKGEFLGDHEQLWDSLRQNLEKQTHWFFFFQLKMVCTVLSFSIMLRFSLFRGTSTCCCRFHVHGSEKC